MSRNPLDYAIAKAIHNILLLHAKEFESENNRGFFRLDGFSAGVYCSLLDLLTETGMQLGNRPVTVRSTAPLGGAYDQYCLEAGRTPTYYRNNLPEGQVLILIFNRITPDRQSLSSLHFINETLVCSEYLKQLINAFETFSREDARILEKFLRLFTLEVREPQLRSIASFLMEVKHNVEDTDKLLPVTSAIAESLPSLGLFKCETLATLLAQWDHQRLATLLKAIDRAALQTLRPIDPKEQEKLLGVLAELPLSDKDQPKTEKRSWLEAYIRGQDTKKALLIDWNEVEPLVRGQRRNRSKKRPDQVRKDIGRAIRDTLIAKGNKEILSERDQMVLAELDSGLDPGQERIESLLDSLESFLPPKLVTKIERHWDLTKPMRTNDFVLGVVLVILKLLKSFDSLSENAKVIVSFDGGKAKSPDESETLRQAMGAFLCLYGGVDVYMPRVQWELKGIQDMYEQELPELADGEAGEEEADLVLPFIVSVRDGENERTGQLEWVLTPHSSGWDFVHATAALQRIVSETSGGLVPLFVAQSDKTPSISKLSESIGPWWCHPRNLRQEWLQRCEHLRGINPSEVQYVDQAIEQLELALAEFLNERKAGILITADPLLTAYEALQEATAHISTQTGASILHDLINRAFVISAPDDSWAVVPLLHPVKLLWFKARCRLLDTVVCKLLEPRDRVSTSNYDFLKRELEQKYTSAYLPAVLALGTLGVTRTFLPDSEDGGSELFRPSDVGVNYMDSDRFVTSVREAVRQAVETVGSTVKDYLESYPFAKAGMRILLANVHSPVLPNALLDYFAKSDVMQDVQLELTVHTPQQGALLYDALGLWMEGQEALRSSNSYFPRIVVRVEEGTLEHLLSSESPTRGTMVYDLVILVDAISEGKQKIVSEEIPAPVIDIPSDEFDPFFKPEHQVFASGQVVRRVYLTPERMPTVLRYFYRSQQLCREPSRHIPVENGIRFVRELELGGWAKLIEELHDKAVWVVCYDLATDRFLLESVTKNDQVHIIRHLTGLGPKQLHNLTVSASGKNRKQVVRRLQNRLCDLLGGASDYAQGLARDLVGRAQSLSGAIVLAATGPGTKMNELMGLVLTQWSIEQRIKRCWGDDAHISWVYFDDHPDWFPARAKRPDLLCVAARLHNGIVQLWLVVAEAKFINQASVDVEYRDATVQVANGLKRLGPGLAPGNPSVECSAWYQELHVAITDNLIVDASQRSEWQLICNAIASGKFERQMEGHVWVFVYDDWNGQEQVREEDLGEVDGFQRIGFIGNRKSVQRILNSMLRNDDEPPVPQWLDNDLGEQASVVEEPANTSVDVAESPIINLGSVMGHTIEELNTRLTTHVRETSAAAPDGATDNTFGNGAPASTETTVPSTSEVAHETEPTFSATSRTEVGHSQVSQERLALRYLQEYDVHSGEDEAVSYAKQALRETAGFFQRFGLDVRPVDFQIGPRVIRLRLDLRVSKTSTFDKLRKGKTDLKLTLKLKSDPQIRSGDDGYVWVDIPRSKPALVGLKRLLELMPSPPQVPETRFPLGVQLDNEPYYADLRKVPHWLVGGTSGSGKSVFIRSVLLSLLINNSPDTLRLVIIDPKGDLTAFRDTPYTFRYVSSRRGLAQQAASVLAEITDELDRRLDMMRDTHGVNEIDDFNAIEGRIALARYVIVIEEFGDLLSDKEHRDAIQSRVEQIAAIGRAPGFHLFLCTQNPVVENVSTDIKANCSGRVALYVKSHVNSQVILDEPGAEDLLKNGDMLFKSDDVPVRIQAPYVDLIRELRPTLTFLSQLYATPRTEEG